MDDNDFSKELIDGFLDESKEHIATIEDCLLRIENPSNDEELVNKAFRAIHTIKGNSGFFGLQDIHNLSHTMEEIFVKIREKKLPPNDKLISKLLSGVDVLTRMIMSEGIGGGVSSDRILKELQHVLDSFDKIDEGVRSRLDEPAEVSPVNEDESDEVEFDAEILSGFIEESREHVSTVEACLLKMETDGVDFEDINKAFRAIHTIKGNSGFLKLHKISHISHGIEDILVSVRDKKLSPDNQAISVLLSGVDKLFEMVNSEDHGESTDDEQVIKNLEHIQKIFEKKTETPSENSSTTLKQFETKSTQAETEEHPGVVFLKADSSHFIYRIKLDFRALLTEKRTRGIKDDLLELIEKGGVLLFSEVPVKKINQRQAGVATIYIGSEKTPSALTDILCVLESDVFLVRSPCVAPELLEKDAIHAPDLSDSEDVQPVTSPNIENLSTDEIASQKPLNQHPAIVKSPPSDTIRIKLDLLDKIMNITGELVLGRNQLMQQFRSLRDNSILHSHSQRVTELQESVIKTRLQPVGSVFLKFKRIVRDLAMKLEKEISLTIFGEEVELDRTIIESLSDPLTHLIRNCADHALEGVEERILAGKPKVGNITLSAYHERGHVIITIEDDGRGINIEKVGEKALQKEIVTEAELSHMGEKEICNLIFRPGFSTVSTVTDMSGRGVGMDVVKTSFEKIGGSVDVVSSKGKGARITVRLPLTLAIIQALVVDVEECRFAIPQIEIMEVVRIKREEGNPQIELVHGQPVFRLRGKLLPVVRLASILKIKRTFLDEEQEQLDDLRERLADRRDELQGIASGHFEKRGRLGGRRINPYIMRLVVIRYGQHHFGLLVDVVLDPEEIVVKPLPQYVKNTTAFSGSTIMGDGSVAMILDISGLVSMAGFKFETFGKKAAEYEAETKRNEIQEKQSVLVFNYSESEYFALPLSMIARVEQVNRGKVELVGNKEYLILPDENIEIVRLENVLNTKPIEIESDSLFIIIPKLIKPTIGIVATKIVDIIELSLSLTRDAITEPGVLGLFNVNNKIVLMLDIYTIFERAILTPDAVDKRKKAFDKPESIIILLVEDTPFFRLMEDCFFQSVGFNVSLACDGKEALEMLQKDPSGYDIVVTDIEMPVMNGYDLLKHIRSEKGLSHLPVVALTALSNEASRKKGEAAGFDAYEVKIDKDSLIQTVISLLEKKQKRGTDVVATTNVSSCI